FDLACSRPSSPFELLPPSREATRQIQIGQVDRFAPVWTVQPTRLATSSAPAIQEIPFQIELENSASTASLSSNRLRISAELPASVMRTFERSSHGFLDRKSGSYIAIFQYQYLTNYAIAH